MNRSKQPLCRWHWEEKLDRRGRPYRFPVITRPGRIEAKALKRLNASDAGPVAPPRERGDAGPC